VSLEAKLRGRCFRVASPRLEAFSLPARTLPEPVAAFTQRIDLVLERGRFDARAAEVVGDE